jgi:hypothetical protein
MVLTTIALPLRIFEYGAMNHHRRYYKINYAYVPTDDVTENIDSL